jgi:hypothetical protein
MATKKSASKIVVTLGDAKPKKSVTRFDAANEKDALQNAYISNDALKKLGDPSSVKVTIEAA